MDKILVLRAAPWTFADENTGVVRKGLTVHFVGDLPSDDGLGNQPQKITVDYSFLQFFQNAQLPCICDVRFVTRPGAQNKAVVVLRSIENPQPINLFQLTKK